MAKPLVGILMGSDSDLAIMKSAATALSGLGIENEILILSTHRAPEETSQYAKAAYAKGIKVIIAGAGGAAALPGSIAALTTLPVIGVPISTKVLKGVDSLFSIVSMPPGVPVATVGIDSAKNAGLLAAQIIGTSDPKVSKRFEQYKQTMKKEVLQKNTKILSTGWRKYLQEKQSK